MDKEEEFAPIPGIENPLNGLLLLSSLLFFPGDQLPPKIENGKPPPFPPLLLFPLLFSSPLSSSFYTKYTYLVFNRGVFFTMYSTYFGSRGTRFPTTGPSIGFSSTVYYCPPSICLVPPRLATTTTVRPSTIPTTRFLPQWYSTLKRWKPYNHRVATTTATIHTRYQLWFLFLDDGTHSKNKRLPTFLPHFSFRVFGQTIQTTKSSSHKYFHFFTSSQKDVLKLLPQIIFY